MGWVKEPELRVALQRLIKLSLADESRVRRAFGLNSILSLVWVILNLRFYCINN
jgi:hypothetical protein